MKLHFAIGAAAGILTGMAVGQDGFQPRRCEIMPLPEHQVSLSINGVEKTCWHYGGEYPRPFFYPFNGPSGVSLTRMGHPGAQNHDHHRSVWLAHHKVDGLNFWADGTGTQVRQKHWYSYVDGDDEAIMAVALGWFDESGAEVMEQNVVAALRPLPENEHALEFQITTRPASGRESVKLEQTNFGFLAVRVSKSLSNYFGGGQLSNSEGKVGEKEIFGTQARWMDYSGPVIVGSGPQRKTVDEGITYHDHPENVGYPNHWHVRSDGWMGASPGMHREYVITSEKPMVLRYLLHAHSGRYDSASSEQIHDAFSNRSGFVVRKPIKGESHRQYVVERVESRQ